MSFKTGKSGMEGKGEKTSPAGPSPAGTADGTGGASPAPPVPEEELVPQDDRIIGQALKWSFIVLAVLAAASAGVVLYLRRQAPVKVEAPITTAPPLETRVAADPPEVRFTDVTRASGIDFVRVNGATGQKLLPETMGGGAAFVDLDGDGDQDIVFINGSDWRASRAHPGAPAVVLYRNTGDGHFERIAGGPAGSFYGMGVAVGDYDGDGADDLFVTAVGANHLFRNRGGHLTDVTAAAGVAGASDSWSSCAAFFDYDRDGDLDLFVGNYVKWSPAIDLRIDYRLTGIGRAYGPPFDYEGTFPYLYRNNGDGTFTDVSKEAGMQVRNPVTGVPVAKTLAVVPLDVDRDGWIDLFVANDTVRNFLFHNKGNGAFEEIGESYGLAYDSDGRATGAMGSDAGYYRNDPSLGFLIGNFANEMTSLYVSQGVPGLFTDEAINEGIGAPTRTVLSFGLFLFDYDLDGRLDLLQNNGHLEEDISKVDPSQHYRQAPQLFWNAGPDQRRIFVPVAGEKSGDLSRTIVGRGSTFADIDGDGDLDVLLLQTAGPPLLLRNDQRLGHHYLRLKLVGKGMNRDAIGAWAELTAGGVRQRRQVMPTRSYLSQVELPLTFGLGTASKVDSLTITWPDGARQTVDVSDIDLLKVITEP
jgi:enediyne biosynthesis protein E4